MHTHQHSLLDFINTFFQMHLDCLKSPFFFYFIILSIYVDPSLTTTHYNESRYETCVSNSSNCGKSNLTISYPFWRNGSPEYCGHFGFNLSCVGGNFKINMKSYTYNVIDIDYSTSTLKIVSEQFSRGDPCPGPKDLLHNTTLDRALFNYTSNVYNASLYYDCRPETDYLKGEPYSFSCEQTHLQQLSFLLITQTWNPTLQQICGVQLNVPVFEHAFKDLFNLSSLSSSLLFSSPSPPPPPPAAVVGSLLSRGFAVKWVIDQGQCQECYISGGNYCAYNQTLNQSTCMCKDGVYPKVCPQPITPSTGLSLKAKVGIGVAVACGVLLIMLTLFVFKRERKHYHSSSSATSQKTSQLCSTSVEEKSSYFGAQLFSYNELQQATNNFEASKELGKGGFGIVYYGKLQDGRDVAIKRLYENHNKQVEQFRNELEILTQLEHKNLVKLYGCSSRRSPNLLLVYEYIPNGTLAEHLHGKQAYQRSLPWATRLRISIETATALVYLHASDIIHRDVKTKNILLDTNYSVKVADFGLSRLFPMDMSHISTTPQGSPGYVDPEYHQFYQLTNKSDVYSFGVVLAELVSAKPAVDITRNRQEINLSSLAVNKIGERAWAEFVDPNLRFEEQNSIMREQVISVAELTYRCLEATSHARPCMEQVLQILKRIQAEEFVDASTIEGGSTLEESNSNSLKSVIVNVSSGTLESY